MQIQRNKLVVVLGMHRSGTSTITRGLQTMGVALGDRMMPPVPGNNPKGFWEDIDLNALNIELLRCVDSDWQNLSAIDSTDVGVLRKQGYFLRAVELLREKVRSVPVFGFKDPRVAKLLPFWKDVFTHCRVEANFVVVVRNPLSVAKSLAKRDGIETARSYFLWLGHVITSLTGSADDKRVLVDYDRFMQAPELELNRIAKHLGLEIDATELCGYEADFLDQSLRHTIFDLNDLLLDETCPPLAREIYSTLLDVASEKAKFRGVEFKKKVTRWADEFERLRSPLLLVDRLMAQKTVASQAAAERDGQIVNLNSLKDGIVERENQIAGLNQTIVERDGHYAGLSHKVADLETQIANLTDALVERNSDLVGLKQKLTECESCIAGLNQTVLDHGGEVQSLTQELADSELQISALNQATCERDIQIATLNEVVAERNGQSAHLDQKLAECEERILKIMRHANAEQNARRKSEQDGVCRENTLLAKSNETLQSLGKILQDQTHLEQESAKQQQVLRDQAEEHRASLVRSHNEKQEALSQVHAQKEQTLALQLDAERKVSRQQDQAFRQIERMLRDEIANSQIQVEEQKHINQLATQQHSYELNAVKIELNLALEARNNMGGRVFAEQQENNQLRQRLAESNQDLTQIRNSFLWRFLRPMHKLRVSDATQAKPLSDIFSVGYDGSISHQIPNPLGADQVRIVDENIIEERASRSQRRARALDVSESSSDVATVVEKSANVSNYALDFEALIQLDDRSFIDAVYTTLLGRQPDGDGLNFYLEAIRNGTSKLQILREIFFSQERMDSEVELPGLREALAQREIHR